MFILNSLHTYKIWTKSIQQLDDMSNSADWKTNSADIGLTAPYLSWIYTV